MKLLLTFQDTGLDGCTHCHHLVGVDSLGGLLTEKLLHYGLNLQQ